MTRRAYEPSPRAFSRSAHLKDPIKADVCIAGAGAAGLFAALGLAKGGLSVILLESGGRPGRKLAISGGGHANFSNLDMRPDKFLAPPGDKFCSFALKALTPPMLIRFMEEAGFGVIEKDKGRLFLKEDAAKLAEFLESECAGHGARFLLNERLLRLSPEEGGFLAVTDNLAVKAPFAIMALGSPARPKLASCVNCWKPLSDLGHKVFPPKPALTPLRYTMPGQDPLRRLSGISVNAEAVLNGEGPLKTSRSWEDDVLFTHLGLSGPAILCASLYFSAGSSLMINLLPGRDFEKIIDGGGKKTPRSLLRGLLPPRLADALLPEALADAPCGSLSRKDRALLGRAINSWLPGQLKAAGLDSAEVCSGGVDLEQVAARTMESRLFKNLYICGEALNVTGELGGYNLHWAFASARQAARGILAECARGHD